MGAASAKAQGLKGPITSGDKLRMQSEHIVYLLVDRESNAGRGSVVGLLKMGKKNLFLLDRQGEQVTTITISYLSDLHQNNIVSCRPTKPYLTLLRLRFCSWLSVLDFLQYALKISTKSGIPKFFRLKFDADEHSRSRFRKFKASPVFLRTSMSLYTKRVLKSN